MTTRFLCVRGHGCDMVLLTEQLLMPPVTCRGFYFRLHCYVRSRKSPHQTGHARHHILPILGEAWRSCRLTGHSTIIYRICLGIAGLPPGRGKMPPWRPAWQCRDAVRLWNEGATISWSKPAPAPPHLAGLNGRLTVVSGPGGGHN